MSDLISLFILLFLFSEDPTVALPFTELVPREGPKQRAHLKRKD